MSRLKSAREPPLCLDVNSECRPSSAPHRITTRPPVRRTSIVPTVLVVDDDPAVCRIVAKLLRRMGYCALRAHSADDALALLEGTSHIDLVLTDQVMPGMSGVELVARVRSRWPSMPAVLMSGVASVYTQRLFRPTLTKPFSVDELSLCVTEVLQVRKS